MTMSVKSRREDLNTMRQHYQQTTSRTEKTKIINEVVKVYTAASISGKTGKISSYFFR